MGGVNFEVKHIAEIVSENIDHMKFKNLDMDVSYQDPCRLGRYLNVYDQPRRSMTAIPGVEIKEMAHSRKSAICCGTTNWTNCDVVSKQIQQSRLKEAKDAGAETLVTACPKCQIHFSCAGCGEDTEKVDIKLTDFVNIIASALDG